MSSTPTVVDWPDQPYVAITGRVTMQSVSEIADRIPEVFGWLGAKGIAPAGPPFLRYNVIDMAQQLEIEAGVPVVAPVEGDDRVRAGTLPAGRYATVVHIGHPAGLVSTTGDLLDRAARQGLAFDVVESAAGDRWGARLERYLTDPRDEPDPNRWETELALRLAD
jgi:effector-binding domain-containing protein